MYAARVVETIEQKNKRKLKLFFLSRLESSLSAPASDIFFPFEIALYRILTTLLMRKRRRAGLELGNVTLALSVDTDLISRSVSLTAGMYCLDRTTTRNEEGTRKDQPKT